MAPLTIAALAERLDARLEGDGSATLDRVAPIETAGRGEVSFLAHPRYLSWLEETGASALIVAEDLEVTPPEGVALLRVGEPYRALAQALELLHPRKPPTPGVREGAFIHEEADVPEDLVAMPGSVVGRGSSLGPGTVLHAGAVVGEECRLGREVVLYPNVVLYPGTVLGDRVVVHAGSVLGSDGFGYAPTPQGMIKVPQVGRLVVEDDVEIGANCTLDRGSVGKTRIGRNTKIDNLCQVAHNVHLGEDCVLVSQSGVAGSSRLGRGVMLAGQAGVAGHLRLGDGARVAAKGAALRDVEKGVTVAGNPGIELGLWKRAMALTGRLPELFRRLRALERAGSSGESPTHEGPEQNPGPDER